MIMTRPAAPFPIECCGALSRVNKAEIGPFSGKGAGKIRENQQKSR